MKFVMLTVNVIVGATLGAASVSALHAQVVKCTDPKTGAVSYTDAGCAASERPEQMLRRQTAQEAAQERQRAAIAQQRVQREIADIAARRQAEQQERQAAAPAHAEPRAPDKTGTVECQKAKRNLEFAQSSVTRPRPQQLAAALVDVETSCGIDASKYMPPPRPRPPPAPPPTIPRTQVCVPSGKMLICN